MKKSWFTLTELIVAMGTLMVLCLVIFGLYAAVHFVIKLW